MSRQGLHISAAPLQPDLPRQVLQVPAADLVRLSVSALLLAGVCVGTSRLSGLVSQSPDLEAAVRGLRAMGVQVEGGAGDWRVGGAGNGALLAPSVPLDMTDAPLAVCLMAGLVSAYDFPVTFVVNAGAGLDERLCLPLRAMGAQIEATSAGTLSTRSPGTMNPISWTIAQGAADIETAVLLAALNTPGTTSMTASKQSSPEAASPPPAGAHRIATLLQAFGAEALVSETPSGDLTISVSGQTRLRASSIEFRQD